MGYIACTKEPAEDTAGRNSWWSVVWISHVLLSGQEKAALRCKVGCKSPGLGHRFMSVAGMNHEVVCRRGCLND
jgi:hypothetical protein